MYFRSNENHIYDHNENVKITLTSIIFSKQNYVFDEPNLKITTISVLPSTRV